MWTSAAKAVDQPAKQPQNPSKRGDLVLHMVGKTPGQGAGEDVIGVGHHATSYSRGSHQGAC